jgi:hypothetical protein
MLGALAEAQATSVVYLSGRSGSARLGAPQTRSSSRAFACPHALRTLATRIEQQRGHHPRLVCRTAVTIPTVGTIKRHRSIFLTIGDRSKRWYMLRSRLCPYLLRGSR